MTCSVTCIFSFFKVFKTFTLESRGRPCIFPLVNQIANIHWIIEKAKEFQKNIYLCFINYDKAFDCVNHNKLWKILKEMGQVFRAGALGRPRGMGWRGR